MTVPDNPAEAFYASALATKYFRRPEAVLAVQVTVNNFDAVAAWIDDQPYCEVHWMNQAEGASRVMSVSGRHRHPDDMGEQDVKVGDWVVLSPGGKLRAYSPLVFDEKFEVDPSTH